MTIYETRYKAEKAKKTNPYLRSDDRIMKVCGGYIVVSAADYRALKKQK